MSQILKDLNKLAEKMGAPIVGRNISEQVRAISTYYDGTSHGANIAERINEVAHSNIGSGSSVLISKTINQNGNYSATDDEADGYSDVKVNVQPTLTTKSITTNGTYNASSDEADGYSSVTVDVQPPKEKWLVNHGTEFIRIPKEDLAFTTKPALDMKIKILAPDVYDYCQIIGGYVSGGAFNVCYAPPDSGTPLWLDYNSVEYGYRRSISGGFEATLNKTTYISLGYNRFCCASTFDNPTKLNYAGNSGYSPKEENSVVALHDMLIFSAMSYATEEQWEICKAKIAYVKLYDDDVLIFNGVPRINPSTNKACLYDTVNDKYYGNANAESQTDFEIIEED